MNSKQSDRRRFLKNGAALAGLAVGAMQPAKAQSSMDEASSAWPKDAHAYGQRSRFETSVRYGAPGLYDDAPTGWHRDFGLRTDMDPRGLGLDVDALAEYGGELPERPADGDDGGALIDADDAAFLALEADEIARAKPVRQSSSPIDPRS